MGWNRDWNDENAYGHPPFFEGDASRPNEAFWQHADWLINKARDHGLYMALLPAWGSYWGDEAIIEYAQWITNRYKDYENIIWVNGGDRKVGEDKELFNQVLKKDLHSLHIMGNISCEDQYIIGKIS